MVGRYIVPEDARTYDDWISDDKLTTMMRGGAKLLRETLNCRLVGDWLNEQRLPPGPYSRTRMKRNGKKTRAFYANSLLKGLPARGGRHTVKHHESGRRASLMNTLGPKFYQAEHLAQQDSEEFDELNALLKERNANRGRTPLAIERIMQVITDQLENLDGFEDQCRKLVLAASQGADDDLERRRRPLDQQEAVLKQGKNNLLE